MNKSALYAILAAVLVSCGWMARAWYDSSVERQIERVKDAVAAVNAESISKIKVENKTTYAKTVEKIRTEQVYTECKADPVTMELTNKVLEWK